MPSTCVGISIGSSSVKLAAVSGGKIIQTAVTPLPENLLRDGRILSQDAMVELLREQLRTHRMRGKAAVVLPAETAFVRRITVPAMTESEITLNLPYEFRDFIQQELDQYIYDYAVVAGGNGELDLMAAAAREEDVEQYRRMLRRAGLGLKTALPECFAYCNLINAYEKLQPDHPGEYCVIDLGHAGIRVHLYQGGAYETTRVIEYGGASLDAIIADGKHVDLHMAAQYKRSNYEGAQELDICRELYTKIAVEILRALNFYAYNTPDSHLQDVYFCGGLTRVEPLMATIRETLRDVRLHRITELMPQMAAGEQENLLLVPAAVGAAMQ